MALELQLNIGQEIKLRNKLYNKFRITVDVKAGSRQ